MRSMSTYSNNFNNFNRFGETDRAAYRLLHSGLVFSVVAYKESDLHIGAPEPLATRVWAKAKEALPEVRRPLDAYASAHPHFVKTLLPFPAMPDMPPIARAMALSSARVGVGPMAAVAGAVNDFLAPELLSLADELIIENGGDLYIKTKSERTVLVYAGASPLSGRLGIRVPGGTWGICTSSATVGPALSFGKTDAALVVAESSALADAAATGLGNRVVVCGDIGGALEWTLGISGVYGALAVLGGAFGAMGDLELVKLF